MTVRYFIDENRTRTLFQQFLQNTSDPVLPAQQSGTVIFINMCIVSAKCDCALLCSIQVLQSKLLAIRISTELIKPKLSVVCKISSYNVHTTEYRDFITKLTYSWFDLIFLGILRAYNWDCWVLFQQDGALPQFVATVRMFLDRSFPNQWNESMRELWYGTLIHRIRANSSFYGIFEILCLH